MSIQNFKLKFFNKLDRTLSDMREEGVTTSRQLHVACITLEARLTQESTSSGEEASTVEMQLKAKLTEVMKLQGRWDAEKVELNSRWVLLSWLIYVSNRNRNRNRDKEI